MLDLDRFGFPLGHALKGSPISVSRIRTSL